jgi:hypothetical protein
MNLKSIQRLVESRYLCQNTFLGQQLYVEISYKQLLPKTRGEFPDSRVYVSYKDRIEWHKGVVGPVFILNYESTKP